MVPLDLEQLKKTKLSSTKYRTYLIDLLENLEKFPPVVSIDQAIKVQKLLFKITKELYKIDSE